MDILRRSASAAYEKSGKIYSAYQRGEIVERAERVDGKVTLVVVKRSHRQSYSELDKEAKLFNRKRSEIESKRKAL